MNLIDNLEWRYATKRMNGKEVSQDKIDTILEAIRLTPTSLGMQAFKTFVIKDQQLKEKIYAESCHQTQVKTCSHLLVFAANKAVTPEMVEKHIAYIAGERNLPVESLAPYKEKFAGLMSQPIEKQTEWTAKQTYIALGFAMVAAAEEKVDSTPIEGFDPAVLDEILELDKQNLTSITLLTLGYRSEDDSYASYKKVRKSMDTMIVER